MSNWSIGQIGQNHILLLLKVQSTPLIPPFLGGIWDLKIGRGRQLTEGSMGGGGVGTTVLRLLVTGLLASIIKSQFSKLNFNINGVARHIIIF